MNQIDAGPESKTPRTDAEAEDAAKNAMTLLRHGKLIQLVRVEGDHPYYVRGHVTEQEAREALKAWIESDTPLVLMHLYARWGFSASNEYDRELHTYEERANGTFPVTMIQA